MLIQVLWRTFRDWYQDNCRFASVLLTSSIFWILEVPPYSFDYLYLKAYFF